jgi:hypothetical protein
MRHGPYLLGLNISCNSLQIRQAELLPIEINIPRVMAAKQSSLFLIFFSFDYLLAQEQAFSKYSMSTDYFFLYIKSPVDLFIKDE